MKLVKFAFVVRMIPKQMIFEHKHNNLWPLLSTSVYFTVLQYTVLCKIIIKELSSTQKKKKKKKWLIWGLFKTCTIRKKKWSS